MLPGVVLSRLCVCMLPNTNKSEACDRDLRSWLSCMPNPVQCCGVTCIAVKQKGFLSKQQDASWRHVRAQPQAWIFNAILLRPQAHYLDELASCSRSRVLSLHA